MGIIAILATVVIVAINPAKQFAQARNTQRQANLNAILNAIGGRLADNKGVFAGKFKIETTEYECPTISTTTPEVIKSSGGINLSCLYPTYIPAQIPVDPNDGVWTNETNYDSGYTIVASTTGRVIICAPKAGEEASLPSPSSICVTR